MFVFFYVFSAKKCDYFADRAKKHFFLLYLQNF